VKSTDRGKGFDDFEADTGRVDQRTVMFAKLAHVVDHFPPADLGRFVELAEALVDMPRADREVVFSLVSRLSK
jgi:hypothetical protein